MHPKQGKTLPLDLARSLKLSERDVSDDIPKLLNSTEFYPSALCGPTFCPTVPTGAESFRCEGCR